LLAGFVQKAPKAMLLFEETERRSLYGSSEPQGHLGGQCQPAPAYDPRQLGQRRMAAEFSPAGLDTRAPQGGREHLHAPQFAHPVIISSFAAGGFQ